MKPRSPRTIIATTRGTGPGAAPSPPAAVDTRTEASTDHRIERLADDAWLISLLPEVRTPDAQANQRVHRHAARIRQCAPAWLRDLVPAYGSLAVFFDDRRAAATQVRDWLCALLARGDIAEAPHLPAEGKDTGTCLASGTAHPASVVEIPVLYGGDHGQDLGTAAVELGLSPNDLIARHCAAVYTVAMIGFAPGFPYLLGLDPGLALPRHSTPRARVPAGSVAIGGSQTGIYPGESPGGWRLLGRTPLRLFDPLRDPPCLLVPGARVRFRAIDARTFERLVGTA